MTSKCAEQPAEGSLRQHVCLAVTINILTAPNLSIQVIRVG